MQGIKELFLYIYIYIPLSSGTTGLQWLAIEEQNMLQ
jgi:hypothetical protein